SIDRPSSHDRWGTHAPRSRDPCHGTRLRALSDHRARPGKNRQHAEHGILADGVHRRRRRIAGAAHLASGAARALVDRCGIGVERLGRPMGCDRGVSTWGGVVHRTVRVHGVGLGMGLDWFVWKTTPTALTLAGASVIIASGIYLVRHERVHSTAEHP